MNLRHYFDRAYIINLPERTDRRLQAEQEMASQGITGYEFFEAVKHENGAAGIFITLVMLIEKSYYAGLKSMVVFEDDIKAVNSFSEWFKDKVEYMMMPPVFVFDILYLGCNSHELHENRTPFEKIGAEQPMIQFDFLKVKDVYGCHAMIISRSGMFEILKAVYQNSWFSNHVFEPGKTGSPRFNKVIEFTMPIDVLIQQKIQPLGRCYASYPLLFSQHNGFSDIEKKEMNQDYIERRFTEQTEKLFKENNL